MKPSSENLITVSLQISLEIIQILGWLIWVSMAKRKYMEWLKGVLCLQTHSCGNIMSHGGQVPLMSTELTNWVGLLFFFFFYMMRYSYLYVSQFSLSVMSESLWPYGLQHARLPCPSPTPRVFSNSCPSRQWCHPTISSSILPFSSRLQSFPTSGSCLVSQFFASGSQSIGVSASKSVLPTDIQDWFPLG